MGNPAEKTIRHPNHGHCMKPQAEVKPKNAKNHAANGKRKVAVVSWFGAEARSIFPPCASAIQRAMLRPSPQPSIA
jgi:hypothetical protein